MNAENRETRKPMDENTVYVGKKPLENYELAVVTKISKNQYPIHVIARGNSILTAINVLEILKKQHPITATITTKTEEMTDTDKVDGHKSTRGVSVIDIVIERVGKA